MDTLTPPIRNTARALIVQENNILLLRKEGYPDGARFALPGGGQDLGETLEQALLRECREEIGTRVQVRGLVYVADCLKPRDTVPPSTRHLVEFLFDCSIPDDYTPCNGPHPDKHQVAVVWVGLETLAGVALYPRSLARCLDGFPDRTGPLYLGNLDWE
jgi:ADP-ribose pyrophosphatase YjhB (NUDIX family)